MGIMQILTLLLKALAEFLELKNKAYYRDTYRDSEKRQQELINEIEKNRDIGTNTATQRADLVQSLLIKERDFIKSIEHISTKYTQTEGK